MRLLASEADEIVFDHLSENRSRAALRGAFWSALDTLIPTALNSLVFVVTSRFLLPQDFGLVALAFAIVSFTAGFGPTAFGEALIQQKSIRRSHLDTVFWLSFSRPPFFTPRCLGCLRPLPIGSDTMRSSIF